MASVGVVGAGGWGTALAVTLARGGHTVRLWARRPNLARELTATRENRDYLPGVRLPPEVTVTASLDEAANADLALLAVPSAGLLEVAAGLPRGLPAVSCAKGLDSALRRLSEGLAALGFARVGVLSGPNHAEEIGRGLPAATVAASEDPELAATVQRLLAGPSLRVYTASDVAGVELGAATKNVVALAAGMADGLKLGDNAKAALLTRGLAEMVRFAVAHGGRTETLYGLAGLGDLVATCTSPHSRNRAAGERLARGEPPSPGAGVVEGIPTAARLVGWARREGLELPVAEAVNEVAAGRLAPADALELLMGRPPRPE